jgi:SAM-dependent methyltransferase
MNSLTCPVDLDSARLRREVREMYSRVALAPDGSFHFHRGPAYAAEWLGYDATELTALPPEVTQSFAGVGNPHVIAPLPAGSIVVDIGCGGGTDLLLAARRVGPTGRAVGVDMTADMRAQARAGARAAGLTNVEVLEVVTDYYPARRTIPAPMNEWCGPTPDRLHERTEADDFHVRRQRSPDLNGSSRARQTPHRDDQANAQRADPSIRLLLSSPRAADDWGTPSWSLRYVALSSGARIGSTPQQLVRREHA